MEAGLKRSFSSTLSNEGISSQDLICPPSKIPRTLPPPLLRNSATREDSSVFCSCPPFECTCIKTIDYSGSVVMNFGSSLPNQYPGRNYSVSQLPIDPYFVHLQQGETVTDTSFYPPESYRLQSQNYRGSSYGSPPVSHNQLSAQNGSWNQNSSVEWYPNQSFVGNGSSDLVNEWSAESWNNSPPVRNNQWNNTNNEPPQYFGQVANNNDSCCISTTSNVISVESATNLPLNNHDLIYDRNASDNFSYNTKLDLNLNGSDGMFNFEDSLQPQDIFALEQTYEAKKNFPSTNDITHTISQKFEEETEVVSKHNYDSANQKFLQSIDAYIW
ncbi:hypothetical protein Avbf_16032 [Armadillidium vulgare]|nr:hypothetical protein Avbf_16032 [Armadillidium vulgare]